MTFFANNAKGVDFIEHAVKGYDVHTKRNGKTHIGILNWNTSKGNQVPIQKFDRPNRKMPKS